MDIDAIAKKAREKIFARVEDDRCLHASSVEEEIARAIREAMPQPSWYGGVVALDLAPLMNEIDLRPGAITWAPTVDDEYR